MTSGAYISEGNVIQQDNQDASRGNRQTFLVSERFYLRAVSLADAETAAIWRRQPFPTPAPLVETQLRKRFERSMHEEERDQLFVACRRDNDQLVGSVETHVNGWRSASVDFHVDPLMPPSWQDRVLAELIPLVVTWLISERNLMYVNTSVAAGQDATEQTISTMGGRLACQFREFLLVDGKRHSQNSYQFFNSTWIKKLGEPPQPRFGPFERRIGSPARLPVILDEEERPAGAMVCGARVYLRPFDPAEGNIVQAAAAEETEIVFPEGRWMVNAYAYGHESVRIAELEPPTATIFAIALRQTDELIGAIILMHIDWLNRTAETAMELYRVAHRNFGYGTEAKHLILAYGFDQLGLHAVSSEVNETNPRSAAALRKQGYRDAGYTAWNAFAPGGLSGSWAFDLLADEWRAARRLKSDG